MRWYGHKCHFRIIIFYLTFSPSSQYLIQRFLSLFSLFSLSPADVLFSFFFRSLSLTLKSTAIKLLITDQAVFSFHVRHRSTVWRPHRSTVRHSSTSLSGILIALSPRWSRNHRSRHRRSRVCGFVLVDVDVGWWMWVCADGGFWDVALFGLVDVGLSWFLWLFFFFFGGFGFVLVVAVGVVAAMVVVLLLLLLMMMMRMKESN